MNKGDNHVHVASPVTHWIPSTQDVTIKCPTIWCNIKCWYKSNTKYSRKSTWNSFLNKNLVLGKMQEVFLKFNTNADCLYIYFHNKYIQVHLKKKESHVFIFHNIHVAVCSKNIFDAEIPYWIVYGYSSIFLMLLMACESLWGMDSATSRYSSADAFSRVSMFFRFSEAIRPRSSNTLQR